MKADRRTFLAALITAPVAAKAVASTQDHTGATTARRYLYAESITGVVPFGAHEHPRKHLVFTHASTYECFCDDMATHKLGDVMR